MRSVPVSVSISSVVLLLLAACADPTHRAAPSAKGAPAAAPDLVVSATVPLPAPALLRRLSLDVRGTLPTEAELAAVEADPAALAGLREEMLADDRFARRLADLFAEQWLTRVDEFNVGPADYHLDDVDDYTFTRAVGGEPVVFMAAVADADLPWSEIVLADWTMANDVLMRVYSLEKIGDEDALPGWYPARYTDDRPAGGVLMTNGLWWRYWSAPANYNRSRAAALSRLLLCDDFLTRPISFNASSLLEGGDLDDATRQQEACVGCHVTLDPLAGALFGFWWFDLYDAAETRAYHAEREHLGESYLGVPPTWFGTPVAGPAELGHAVATDPRFRRCTVRRIAQAYWRRPTDDADFATINALEDAFVAGDERLRVLIRAVLDTPEYRAGGLSDAATDADAARVATRRVMSPSQLARVVEDATGYRWTADGVALLDEDVAGFRVLAGGLDGVAVTAPQEDPMLTQQLVVQRVAEAAAAWAVARELDADPADRLLLGEVTREHGPADADFRDTLVALHRRLHGASPTDARLAAEGALWEEVAAEDGVDAAWEALVTVLLRDPELWTY